MNRRSGLGRGLGSLIPHTGTEPRRLGGTPTLTEIAVADITPNPNQPRVHFDEESLGELADSIAQLGLLQPILVRRVPDGYQLIAGERRWRAARRGRADDGSGGRAGVRRRRAPSRRRWSRTSTARTSPPSRRRRPTCSSSRSSSSPTTRSPSGSARAAHRSPTRCGCSVCRPRCSACSPTASSAPATPRRCSGPRIGRCRSAWPRWRSRRDGRCARRRRSCAPGECGRTMLRRPMTAGRRDVTTRHRRRGADASAAAGSARARGVARRPSRHPRRGADGFQARQDRPSSSPTWRISSGSIASSSSDKSLNGRLTSTRRWSPQTSSRYLHRGGQLCG